MDSVDIDADDCAEAGVEPLPTAISAVEVLADVGVPAYIERSRSGGCHVWVFFSEPIPAVRARALMRHAVDAVAGRRGFHIPEIFPKQDGLAEMSYGNYVNLPLFGTDVPQGRTVFLNSGDGHEPYENQWEFLQSVQRVPPSMIDELIDAGTLAVTDVQTLPDSGVDGMRDSAHVDFGNGEGLDRVLTCDFIIHCRDNAASLSEPLWYAMISNLCRFDGGRERVHELSRPYPDYSEPETDKKIEHALSDTRPHTCEWIREQGFDCPKYGQCGVRSPAALAYKTDDIKKMIERIPAETDKLELPGILEPALREIARLAPAERTAYLDHLIKPRFKLTNRDMRAYDKTVAQFALETADDDDDPAERTEAEREEAMEFLRSPGLMEQTIADQTQIGIVGEDEVKGLLHLAYTSRKSPEPISLELRAPSGVGKSLMALTATLLMPEEDVIVRTRITSKYLDYLKEDSLVGKIFIVMERPGSEDADYSVRMLTDDTSSGICIGYLRKNPVTGEFEPAEKTVKGPLVFVQTSTKLDANPENDSRVFNVYLDDGEEQRRAVHDAVRRSCLPHQSLSDADREAILRRHRNAQRLLEPLPVAVPYAHLVEFPAGKYRSTRDLKRFLSYIKTSAFYHQFQRPRCEINGRTYIVASVVDYEIAYNLARKVLIDALSDLNPSSRELLDAAIEIRREKKQLIEQGGEDSPKDEKFTRKELEAKLRWDRYRVHRAIGPLETAGYFDVEKTGRAYQYELIWDEESREADLQGILTPDELELRIAEHIGSIDDLYTTGEIAATIAANAEHGGRINWIK